MLLAMNHAITMSHSHFPPSMSHPAYQSRITIHGSRLTVHGSRQLPTANCQPAGTHSNLIRMVKRRTNGTATVPPLLFPTFHPLFPVSSFRNDEPRAISTFYFPLSILLPLPLSLLCGIIQPLKPRWERVRPPSCQRTRDSVSRDSRTGRKSSRSCKPKSVALVETNGHRE